MYPPNRQFSYFSWASRIKLDFFSMIFQGSWFVQYKSFPPPEGRPRGFASSYKPSPQSFRENFCFSSYAQQGFLLYPVLQNRGSCCASWGFFRKRHTTIRSTSAASYLLSFWLASLALSWPFRPSRRGDICGNSPLSREESIAWRPLLWTVSEQNWGEILHSSA